MKRRHKRLLMNALAFTALGIAIYLTLFHKDKPLGPNQTLNVSTATNR